MCIRRAIQTAIVIGFNGRTRLVDMKLMSSREYVVKKLLTAQYVPASEQRADILTKGIRKPSMFDFGSSVLAR